MCLPPTEKVPGQAGQLFGKGEVQTTSHLQPRTTTPTPLRQLPSAFFPFLRFSGSLTACLEVK